MNRLICGVCVAVLVALATPTGAARAAQTACPGVSIRHVDFMPIANGYRFRVAVAPGALTQGAAPAAADLRLALDGQALGGGPPAVSAEYPNVLEFRFLSTDADPTGYHAVSRHVTYWGGGPPVLLELVPGTETASPPGSGCGASTGLMLVRSRAWLVAGALFLLAALVAFIVLAVTTDIVRDRNPRTLLQGERRPYSLSRCQMAFWFFVVLASYLFLLAVTFDFNGILNAQSLVLIGISSATWMAAATVDTHQTPDGSPWPVHESFLTDLLTDRNGVTLHRFQMLVLTLLLGGIYLVSVWRNLALPSFDDRLLGLIGISSGVYVGLKIPEKQT